MIIDNKEMKNQESLNIDTENKQSIDNNKYWKLKKSVKKIKNTDNFGLISAVVINQIYLTHTFSIFN